jgi:aspartyl protease family protein
VLRIDGQTRRFELGREYSEGFSAPSKQQISIARGLGGHYWVAGSVDGHPMQFLVDTGATSLAINEQHAKRLGLDYRVKGRPMLASTASGTAKGWKLSVDRVKVGSLEVLGVDTVVLEGDAPTEALLGMSFLSRVRWREEQGVLVLESKL